MPVDLDAEPWRTARTLLAEFGDNSVDEVWRRGEVLMLAGRPDEARALLPLMQAVIALKGSREAGQTIN